MEIGLVVPHFNPDNGWQYALLRAYIKALTSEHGIRVFVLGRAAQPSPYQLGSVLVLPVGADGAPADRLASITQHLQQQHQYRPLDVLHAFGSGLAGRVMTLASQQMGLPGVVTLWDDELAVLPDLSYGQLCLPSSTQRLRAILQQAAAIVVPSEFAAETLRTEMGAVLSGGVTLHTVPFGVDTAHFTPPEPALDYRPRAFVHVGALEPVNDQRLLLQLVATLPNATLDIVGDGTSRAELEAFAVECGIADRVVFHGVVAYERLPAYYQEARFFLTTARYSLYCMEAVQALACGTGVIGTAVGVIPELGAAAPVGDLEQLQRLIVKRARTQTGRLRFRNRLLAERAYSLQQMVNLMTAIYAQVAAT